MMHGYLPFDREGRQLAEFRTWRNTITEEESRELTELFGFNIPQRWSIAHLWRAIRRGEEHVSRLGYLTTLAGYVHWRLTGRRVLGVGEASGMFPIDSAACDFHQGMVERFDRLAAPKGYPWKLRDILPQVLPAGAEAGSLTSEGTRLLDPSGILEPGAPLCPPEGDAGTGMAATNSVRARTGNVSAGTSVFAMAVLEKPLSQVYPEIDMVTTPDGLPVAMVHVNTCTSDLDAWVGLFGQVLEAAGSPVEKGRLYELLYRRALEGEPGLRGASQLQLLFRGACGRPGGGPSPVRPPAGAPPSPWRTSCGPRSMGPWPPCAWGWWTSSSGRSRSGWRPSTATGGCFKTPGVGQRLLAGALGVPVAVMETAGEGGPWGMALLAAYRKNREPGEALPAYLEKKVFAGAAGAKVEPDPRDAAGFAAYMERYKAGLAVERAAGKALG